MVAMGNWKPTPIPMRNLNVNHLGPPGKGDHGNGPQCHQAS